MDWKSLKKDGRPPQDSDPFYGNRYSVPVAVGNIDTGETELSAHMYDMIHDAWVPFHLSQGTAPGDYETMQITHRASWPTCKLKDDKKK